ncbi:MAG: glycosyltransferase [Alteromonadaceae bacterium]|nr:glycosyltransferase [Alteromonadaceae bacterium]
MSRIAFYLTSFDGGGAERNTALIAAEMSRQGHTVLVIVDRDTGPNRKLLPSCVQVEILSSNFMRNIFGLRRILNKWRADVVFARLGLCPIVATLAKPRSCRLIISYHNPYDPNTSLGVRATWWAVPVLSRIANATFGVSVDIKNELLKFGAPPRRCHSIPNPVALDWINSNKDEALPIGFPTRKPFILSVGRLVPQKGYSDLIAAYASIADKVNEELVILGQGPLEKELREQIQTLGVENRVHLAGYMENPFPAYASCRLFVLASHWEGFGNVMVEALACGASVVATNCPGGPKDILENGRFGTLVQVQNPSALAKAILTTLNTSADIEQNISRASDYALSKITNQYVNLILAD